MTPPLEIVLSKAAAKSLQALDAPTRQKIKDKIEAVAADPLNPRNSYPFQGTIKRTTRVGNYRILLLILEPDRLAVDIVEPSGQAYRRI